MYDLENIHFFTPSQMTFDQGHLPMKLHRVYVVLCVLSSVNVKEHTMWQNP